MPEKDSFNLKLPLSRKEKFSQTAEEGVFPFEVTRRFNWDDPRMIQTYHKDGKLMMPVEWRDEDDEDDKD